MDKQDVLAAAIGLLGLRAIALITGVSYQAVQHWANRRRLPRTEYSGETNYAELIAQACVEKDSRTKVTREALLGLPSSAGQPAPSCAVRERVA